jgi:hypothetical protein
MPPAAMNTITHIVHSNSCATLRAKSNTPTTYSVRVPLAAIQAAACAVRIRGDTALHTSDSDTTNVHDNALPQQCSDAIELKGRCRCRGIMQADSWHPANRADGIACRHLLLTTAAQQLGLANAAATQPRSASRYINRTAAKITAQPSTSSAQSISQRIRIGFGLSAAAMRALKPNTAMPHTHHCDNILHISSFLHTGIDM